VLRTGRLTHRKIQTWWHSSCIGSSCAAMISRLAARFWPSLQVGRGCLAAPASPSPASRALRLLPASRGRPPRKFSPLDSPAFFMQSLHRLRMRWCSQMLSPPHSLHRLLCRWCSQMADPPQSLHLLRCRWCSQMRPPPHSLHRLRMRWCSQKADPPHSLQYFAVITCLGSSVVQLLTN